jgi:hypothetical protein
VHGGVMNESKNVRWSCVVEGRWVARGMDTEEERVWVGGVGVGVAAR